MKILLSKIARTFVYSLVALAFGIGGLLAQAGDCDFSVTIQVNPICKENNITTTIDISSLTLEGSRYNIYIDGKRSNTDTLVLEGSRLSYDIIREGDGKKHELMVELVDHPNCSYTTTVDLNDCYADCSITNLKVEDFRNTVHTVRVSHLGFHPHDIEVKLGDRVRFLAVEDNVGVVAEAGDESWNSGSMNTDEEYFVTVKEPRRYEYSNRVNGAKTGVIRAQCADEAYQPMTISFDNIEANTEGFIVKVDDFRIDTTTYAYDASGTTELRMDNIMGDGLSHRIEIVDVKTGCRVSQEYRAINCRQFFPCAIRLSHKRVSRCDDNVTKYEISGVALNRFVNFAKLYQDGEDIMGVNMSSRSFSTVVDVPSTGATAQFVIYNSENKRCRDTMRITTPDCSAESKFLRLSLEGGRERSTLIDVRQEDVLPNLIYNEVGQQIYLSFADEFNELGIRSNGAGPLQFDTGLQSLGYAYLPPLFPVGEHFIEVYDKEGKTLYTKKIYVGGTENRGLVTVNYRFDDINGKAQGYDIYVDGVKYNTEPLTYSVFGSSQGFVRIMGDNKQHRISIQDVANPAMRIEKDIFLPGLIPSNCKKYSNIIAQDSCDNRDRYDVELIFENENSYGDRFDLYKNGVAVSPVGIPYENGSGFYKETIDGDGSVVEYVFVDRFDKGCRDTLRHSTVKCETPCTVSDMRVEIIDEDYYNSHPGTPVNFIGCIDSIQYYSVFFSEKYSDSKGYRVFLDGVQYNNLEYKNGDGVNQFFIPVHSDGLVHEIGIEDLVDPSCRVTQKFKTKECFNPCKVIIKSIANESCILGVSTYRLTLDEKSHVSDIYMTIDGKSTPLVKDNGAYLFQMAGDSITKKLYVGSKAEKDSLCFTEYDITPKYCMPCDYVVESAQVGECTEKDSLAIDVTIKASTADNIRIKHGSEVIDRNLLEDGRTLRMHFIGDGYDKNITITTPEDPYCIKTYAIPTIDCSPVVCSVNYDYLSDGMSYSFEDRSSTTEPIKKHSWLINDIISYNDVYKFSITFDDIGDYKVCRYIETDSCDNMMCRQIEVKDPCGATDIEFTPEVDGNIVSIKNPTMSQYDEVQFDMGDGTFIKDTLIEHTYAKSGTYEICATVKYSKYGCFKKTCHTVSVSTTSVNDISQNILVYPNPLDRREDIIVRGVDRDVLKRVVLHNSQGQTQAVDYQYTDQSTFTLRSSNMLHAGVYYLTIETETGEARHRLIVF